MMSSLEISKIIIEIGYLFFIYWNLNIQCYLVKGVIFSVRLCVPCGYSFASLCGKISF